MIALMDKAFSRSDRDFLYGDAGNDILSGGTGADELRGGDLLAVLEGYGAGSLNLGASYFAYRYA